MTAFFSDFPKIEYETRFVKDITIRLDFLSKIKNNVALFQHENLKDGERPEDVAFRVYGDPELYWIVLFINDIVDPFHGWLLTEERLYEFIQSKYGAENVDAIHHYETTSESSLGEGVWVSQGEAFSKSISNYTYETQENEKKRKIKILKNRYVQQVLSEYKAELRSRK